MTGWYYTQRVVKLRLTRFFVVSCPPPPRYRINERVKEARLEGQVDNNFSSRPVFAKFKNENSHLLLAQRYYLYYSSLKLKINRDRYPFRHAFLSKNWHVVNSKRRKNIYIDKKFVSSRINYYSKDRSFFHRTCSNLAFDSKRRKNIDKKFVSSKINYYSKDRSFFHQTCSNLAFDSKRRKNIYI